MSSFLLHVAGLGALTLWAPAAVPADPPAPSEEATVRLLADYSREPEGRVIASFPTIVSDANLLLDSMGPVPTNPQCFAGWKTTLDELVAGGYLSGYLTREHTLGIETGHVTEKGAPFFGPVYPVRFHTTVKIIPDPAEARFTITSIESDGAPDRILVEFRCPPCEPFGILWRNGVLKTDCRGQIDESVVLENGDIRGHAHIERRGGQWTVVRLEIGPHRADE